MREKIKTPQKVIFYWGHCFTAVIVFVMLACAFTNFVREYGISVSHASADAPKGSFYFPREYFYIDFYVFYTIYAVNLFVFIFEKNFYLHFLSFLVGIASASLLAYTAGDLYTIKLFIFLSWILTVSAVIPICYNALLAFASIAAFVVVQFYPGVFGIVDASVSGLVPVGKDSFTMIAYLVLMSLCGLLYRYLVMQWAESVEYGQHINMVMSQMTVFNQKLQNIAKTRGEEAAKQERLRITRDMHDSCGYVFVNIASLMDAAESRRDMSRDQIDDTFMTVRNLASDGLQETRRTLHAIRDMQNPIENGIDAIYDIKRLFEQVTGIQVTVDSGNIKHDYGRTIDSLIIRTMQEALTNAIRHGRAEHIFAAFWEENSVLTMSVKDDGVGSKNVVKGIGLAGMEERLEKAGGVLDIESPKEGGFKITIHIPLTGQEGAETYEETQNTAG